MIINQTLPGNIADVGDSLLPPTIVKSPFNQAAQPRNGAIDSFLNGETGFLY